MTEILTILGLLVLPTVGLALLLAYLVRRLLVMRRVVLHGESAVAECVEVRDVASDSTDMGGHRFHLFAFVTRDGRRITYTEDAVASYTHIGYRATVHYDPADPARTATIVGRDDLAPVLCLAARRSASVPRSRSSCGSTSRCCFRSDCRTDPGGSQSSGPQRAFRARAVCTPSTAAGRKSGGRGGRSW